LNFERSYLAGGQVHITRTGVEPGCVAGLLLALEADGKAIAQYGNFPRESRKLCQQQRCHNREWLEKSHVYGRTDYFDAISYGKPALKSLPGPGPRRFPHCCL